MKKPTERAAVLRALEEFDRLGRENFLEKYGFARAQKYFLEHEDRLYDSKAIAGVAYGYEHPDRGHLESGEFSGGKATVKRWLEALGFRIVVRGVEEGAAAQEEADLQRLYQTLNELRAGLGGYYRLKSCHGKMEWPRRGVYFFFEERERRSAPHHDELRVVRVGTHAVSRGSGSTLWRRLCAHKGTRAGGGNHRASIFRRHVGSALMRAGLSPVDVSESWGKRSPGGEARKKEKPLERAVSRWIGALPFLWVEVADEPSKTSLRAVIERNSIALLSTVGNMLDPPSPSWLGRYSPHERIRESGLWNIDHVFDGYEAGFLKLLKQCVEETVSPNR